LGVCTVVPVFVSLVKSKRYYLKLEKSNKYPFIFILYMVD